MRITDALLGEHSVIDRLLDHVGRRASGWNLEQAREKAVEPGFEFEDGEHIKGIFEELSGPLGMTYASVYLSDGTLKMPLMCSPSS